MREAWGKGKPKLAEKEAGHSPVRRASVSSPLSAEGQLLQLQRSGGNQAVAQLMKTKRSKKKPAAKKQQPDMAIEEAGERDGNENEPSLMNEPEPNDQIIEMQDYKDTEDNEESAYGESEDGLWLQEDYPDPDGYANQAVLEVEGDLHGNSSIVNPGETVVEKIVVPTDRPQTRFGRTQKAHTISWTLLVHSYAQLRGISVDQIYGKLKEDWDYLFSQVGEYDEQTNYSKFEKLVQENHPLVEDLRASQPAVQLQALLHRLVSNYFIAYQLSPYAIHTDFYSKDGDKPASHGEKESNRFFAELDEELRFTEQNDEFQFNEQNEELQMKETKLKSIEEVRSNLARYLDLGPFDELAQDKIRQHALSLLKYAYPHVWRHYGEDLISGIAGSVQQSEREDSPDIQHIGQSKPMELQSQQLDTQSVESQPEELQQPVSLLTSTQEEGSDETAASYPLGIALRNDNLIQYSAEQIIISQLNLSAGRAPTQYEYAKKKRSKGGNVQQGDHTVAWKLLKEGMEGMVKDSLGGVDQGGTIATFLHKLLERWSLLDRQRWERSELEDKEISYYPERAKLSMAELELALTQQKSILAWTAFLQNQVSRYILAYQKAPLSTYMAKKSKGHNEREMGERLSRLQDKESWKLSELASFGLDLEWTALTSRINKNQDRQLQIRDALENAAIILRNWEMSAKDAYGVDLEGVSDRLEVTESLRIVPRMGEIMSGIRSKAGSTNRSAEAKKDPGYKRLKKKQEMKANWSQSPEEESTLDFEQASTQTSGKRRGILSGDEFMVYGNAEKKKVNIEYGGGNALEVKREFGNENTAALSNGRLGMTRMIDSNPQQSMQQSNLMPSMLPFNPMLSMQQSSPMPLTFPFYPMPSINPFHSFQSSRQPNPLFKEATGFPERIAAGQEEMQPVILGQEENMPGPGLEEEEEW